MCTSLLMLVCWSFRVAGLFDLVHPLMKSEVNEIKCLKPVQPIFNIIIHHDVKWQILHQNLQTTASSQTAWSQCPPSGPSLQYYSSLLPCSSTTQTLPSNRDLGPLSGRSELYSLGSSLERFYMGRVTSKMLDPLSPPPVQTWLLTSTTHKRYRDKIIFWGKSCKSLRIKYKMYRKFQNNIKNNERSLNVFGPDDR